MNITIVHRYFWPDNAPYAQMLFKIAKGLVLQGNTVSVLTSKPSHSWGEGNKAASRQVAEGVMINRLPLLPEFGRNIILRGINTLLFALQLFFILLAKRTDVVMVASTPPVLIAAVIRRISKIKKVRYVYHCQDIHPEAMLNIGVLSKGIVYNLLEHIDSKNILDASAVIVLSEDMKITLQKRDLGVENIYIINNFIYETFSIQHIKPVLDSNYFNILFAGNLGRFQNLEVVIEAAKRINNKKIRFVFLGEGVARKQLETQSGNLLNNTIFFYDRVSASEALNYIAVADIGLISIAKNVIKVAYPSKTMMYLSTGLPVLVLVEESELQNYVKSNNLGYSFSSNDPKELADLVEEIYKNKKELSSRKQEIAAIAKNDFGEEVTIKKWVELFSKLKTNAEV